MTDRLTGLRRFAVPLLACALIAGCHAHGHDRYPPPGYYGWRGPDRSNVHRPQHHHPPRWDWKRDHDRDGDRDWDGDRDRNGDRGRHWLRD